MRVLISFILLLWIRSVIFLDDLCGYYISGIVIVFFVVLQKLG